MPTAPAVRVTRRPTNKPGWPFIVLAGVDHSGKSYSAAELTGSPLIGRSFWIEYGESSADEYGAVPGADYEIVPHDGSIRDVTDAVRWAAAEPRVSPEVPNLIVFDSATPLWETLVDEQQRIADRRRKTAEGEATITTDQWNIAKARWTRVMLALKRFDGIAVMTTRLDEVVVMKNGQPTTERAWKVQAHKSLPYAADVLVEYRARRKATLVGSRSLVLPMPEGESELPLEDFTLQRLLSGLALDKPEGITTKQIVTPNAAAYDAEVDAEEGAAPAAAPDLDERFAVALTTAIAQGPDAVRQLGNEIGLQALGTITFTSPKSGRMDGVEAIKRALGALTVDAAAQPAAQGARTQEPVSAHTAAQPRAEQGARPAQQQEAPAAQDVGARAEETRTRALLMRELAQQEEVLQRSRDDSRAAMHAEYGVVGQPTTEQLEAFVFAGRGSVVDALRAEGRATEAEAYAAHAVAGAIETWPVLLGNAAPAQEPTFEQAIGQQVNDVTGDILRGLAGAARS